MISSSLTNKVIISALSAFKAKTNNSKAICGHSSHTNLILIEDLLKVLRLEQHRQPVYRVLDVRRHE